MGSSDVEIATLRTLCLDFCHNGQGNEGDEGHGSNEGHARHEEEDREQDRQGPNGKGIGLPWLQGQDRGWNDRCFPDQEQARQDREQEKIRVWQEESLDCCRDQGKEGIGPQGLRCNQEGLSSLQEGQGALPVNILSYMNMPGLQLRAWGCLRPSSAIALDGYVW